MNCLTPPHHRLQLRVRASPVRENPWLIKPQTSAKAHPQVQRDTNSLVKGVFFNNLSNFTPLTGHFATTTPSTSSRATIPSNSATASSTATYRNSCAPAPRSEPQTNTDPLRLRLAYAFRLHLPRTFYLPPLRQQVTTARLICIWQIRRVWQPILLLVPTARAEWADRPRACRAAPLTLQNKLSPLMYGRSVYTTTCAFRR